MKLEIRKDKIQLITENETEQGYIESVLGLKETYDCCVCEFFTSGYKTEYTLEIKKEKTTFHKETKLGMTSTITSSDPTLGQIECEVPDTEGPYSNER